MTDEIRIHFDSAALVRELNDLGKRQAPFAIANALNSTADDVQNAEQNVVASSRTFVIRSENSRRFLARQIRRNRGSDFANKRKLVSAVRIQSSGRASLLSLIDQGGVRTSRFALGSGHELNDPVVPVPAREHPRAALARSLYPKNLKLRNRGKFWKSIKGEKRTFVVRTKGGTQLVLQRQGKDRVRTLFVVKPDVDVRPKNFFGPTAQRVAVARFDANLEAAFIAAVRTAR